MAVAVVLPKIGMTMEDAVLTRWLLEDGASVDVGDAMFEIDVEKVLMEVEAEVAGTLRHLVGDCIRFLPGAVVAAILEEGETEVPEAITKDVANQWSEPAEEYRDAAEVREGREEPAADAPAAASEGPEEAAAPAAESDGGRVLASPIARRLAEEHGVDLASIAGSGPRGRVTEADVRDQLDGASPATDEVEVPADAEAAPAPAGTTTQYSGRRHFIGERMLQSLQRSAQLTLTSEVRVEEAVRMARGLSREWRGEGVVVTFTMLVVRAAALALREHPRLNARLADGQIVEGAEINLGIAIDDPGGLMVPVIRHADVRSLQEVAGEYAALARKVESNELSLDEVTGGTFTVTSLESTGVDVFTPVLNPPQAAILGVGRVRSQPVVEEGAIIAGQTAVLSLTFDHRVTDGAPAARFLDRVSQLLSRPYLLM
jgi:pyruvate dehydrogenase E2 component (dihydrolipoamide acetyltransferase)